MAAAIANAMPVLPLVASIKVSPTLMSPRASARLIIFNAGRSLTEPAGLLPSNFTSKVLPVCAPKRCNLTKGVLPTHCASVIIAMTLLTLILVAIVKKNR